MNSPLLFRSHRGALEESMKTVKEINSKEELFNLIEKEMDMFGVLISIEHKPYIYDSRINWETWIVTATFDNNLYEIPIGYLNKKPDWIKNNE